MLTMAITDKAHHLGVVTVGGLLRATIWVHYHVPSFVKYHV